MGFTDRMMRAKYRALHKAETALGGVRMRKATKLRKFICRVVSPHGVVVCKEAWHAGQSLVYIDNRGPARTGTEAQVAELVDALVSGTSGESRGGSSPLLGTSDQIRPTATS